MRHDAERDRQRVETLVSVFVEHQVISKLSFLSLTFTQYTMTASDMKEDKYDSAALLSLDVEAVAKEAQRLGKVDELKVSIVSCIDTAIPF